VQTESSFWSDAVPKKRGPKTDVLEALLKRVDGLEKRLRTEGERPDSQSPTTSTKEAVLEALKSSEDSPPNAPRTIPELNPTASNVGGANGAPAVVASSKSQRYAINCLDMLISLTNEQCSFYITLP
jgi:hypothetical protein